MRKTLLAIAVVALLGVAGTQYIMQLAPEAVITIEAIPPVKIAHDGWDTHISSGMDVVGVQSLVYLSGAEASGEEITMYEWTLTGPDGSTAIVEGFDPVGDGMYPNWQIFRPDIEGSYEVGLTVTTASGTATTSVPITAGMYVGVGRMGGLGLDTGAGQCSGCHSDIFDDWSETNHSSFFSEGIDGEGSSHYNESCIDCHTAGFDPSAVNGGFDDLQAEHGWMFPDTLQAGNWDAMVADYPEVAALANIQCENCHGPGSLHKGDKAKIDVTVMTGMCGQCHNDGHYHRRGAMWETSGHGSGTSFSRGTRESCATCHSTWGFIATIDPTSDHDQKVGTGLDKVECVACHDPHAGTSEEHPFQLRTVEDVELVDGTVVTWGGYGKACMTCHQARRTGATQLASGSTRQDPHHSNQTDMLAGNSVAHTFGRYIPSSTHRDALEDACVDCHMAATPGSGMPGADIIGDHSFAMTAELEDGTLAENTAACVDCHGEFDSFKDFPSREDYDGDGELEGAQDELHGLMDNLAMLLPPVGDVDIEGVDNDTWTKLQIMGVFNHNYVHDDASNGMHNFQYAINLMKVTIDAMNYGLLAPGQIVEVTDVPNDQGKQVNVVWTRFGGDGTSNDPVTMYYVWRKGMSDAAGKTVTVYNDVTEVPDEPLTGPIALSIAGDFWTAVGSQPAAEMPFYGAVVPTLYDATATDTTMTEFMVTAHTAGNNNVESPAMSGYSMDNLVPMAPMGIAAAVRATDVTLTWEDPVDADFNYFAIYRSDVSGFDPAGMTAMATSVDPLYVDTDVEVNTYYYYRIAAVDFAGNVGEASEEVVAAVSVGVEGGEMPIEFALNPNYPNPFNPTTTIAFDIASTSFVRVAVYDLLGRQVQTLVSETRDAGRHSVQLNASSFSSGLYIVRMEAAGRVFERAITLIK